jgi:hypothetical protein
VPERSAVPGGGGPVPLLLCPGLTNQTFSYGCGGLSSVRTARA